MKLIVVVFWCIAVGSVGFAQDPGADLVILGGMVWTGSSAEPVEAAIAVVGNKIAAVAKEEEIKKWIRPQTKVIDAKGKLVLPGFNDAHVHFMAIGNKFSSLDLSRISSADELYQSLRYYSRFLPKGRWILGGSGSDGLWRAVEADKLNAAAPDNPAFLYHSNPTSALVNSLAVKSAKVSSIEAGIIRGRNLEILRREVPSDHSRRRAEIAETASNYAASYGVTSVQDMHSDDMSEVYRELEAARRLKTRIYDCTALSAWMKTKKQISKSDPEAMVRTGCLKGFHEGDDDWTPELRRDLIAADKAGWQVAVHAIGTGPSRIALEIFEAAAKANGPRDRRFRLEHAEGVPPEGIPRLGKLGIIASVQPYLFGGGRGYRTGYYADLLKNAGRFALGSDAPMTSFDPLLGLIGTTSASQGFSLGHAINAYTAGSAFAEFTEEKKGTLSPGKLADIVILSHNIFAASGGRMSDVGVEYTVVNGRLVYVRD